MDWLTFTIEGPPVAKARPRVTRFGNTYTPKKTREFEQQCGEAAKASMLRRDRSRCENGWVAVHVTSYIQIPKSLPKKKQREMEGRRHHEKENPDVDNLLKAVLDGIQGVVMRNDSQVAEIFASKWWSMTPHTEVLVRWENDDTAA